MLPLIIDISQRRIMVIGRGAAAQQRLELVHGAGAERIYLYAIDQDGWACHAEAVLYERLPVRADFEGASIVFIAGLPDDVSAKLADKAREAGALVNVEDVPSMCDFHVPALVRRGDLVISVSTGGKSPGLAQKIRGWLQQKFGPEWTARVRHITDSRVAWRSEGVPKDEISRRTSAIIDGEGWLREHETT
jgi:precorrin-2 dehydrogenase/sirohydrochlorin ferrochelatase